MSRTSLLLAASAGGLALFAALLSAVAAATDIVELPALSVTESRPASPAAISVVDTDIAPADENAFADAARQTAGLAVNDAGGRGFGQTVTLRGLGNTPFFSDASAPVYLGDIPLGSVFTFPTELYDYSRMTVYRGPQANALFGRAGDAGVIQFNDAAPAEKAGGHFNATIGDYNLYSFTAGAQSARTDQFDASLHLGSSQRDGYIYNTDLHTDVDYRNTLFGRINVHYRPAGDLELSLNLIGQRTRDGAQALVPLGGPFYTVSRGKEGVSDADFGAASLGLTKKFSDSTVTATTSFTNWQLSPYSNRLVVYGGIDFDSVLNQSQRAFNEEVRYASDFVTGGLFYSHGRTEGGASRTFSGFTIEDSNFVIDSDSVALFGQTTFKPSPGWLITPGLRLEHDAKDFTRVERVPADSLIEQDDSWTAFLPSVGVTRHLTPATDLVVTLSRGFKPGGYSAYTGVPSLTRYDPQTTWGLEAAISTAAKESHWSFTSRAYAYRVNGYQIERSFAVPDTGTDEYLVVNAKRARVLGLEVEATWQPVTDVTVTLAAGLTDVTLQDFTDPYTGISYAGDRAPYAPTGNGALRVAYRPARGFFASADLTWTGRTFYDEQETAGLSQDAYTLFDASAGYAFARADISIFGRNLGDKAYYTSITAGVAHGTPGAPGRWGGEFNYHW